MTPTVKGELEMVKRISIGLLASAALFVLALEGGASARSVSASTGKARYRTDTPCFSYSFTTGVVTSSCTSDFIVPLTTDHSGTKSLAVTGKATGPGAAICRAVANNRFATALSASQFVEIPVSTSYVQVRTGSVSVPSKGVFLADCIVNNGTRLSEFDYPE